MNHTSAQKQSEGVRHDDAISTPVTWSSRATHLDE